MTTTVTDAGTDSKIAKVNTLRDNISSVSHLFAFSVPQAIRRYRRPGHIGSDGGLVEIAGRHEQEEPQLAIRR